MIHKINSNNSITETVKLMSPGDILLLEDGVYNEKVLILKNNITIKAINEKKVTIQNNDYYHKIMPNNNECNTFGTYTMFIGSNDVKVSGLIIKNLSTPSNVYGQAVSLHVSGNRFLCENSIIESAQDTLFTGPLPDDLISRYTGFHKDFILTNNESHQVYNKCTIIGDVDYIFGCGTVLFNECDLITINNNSNNPAFICAPSHKKELPYGYLFYKCNMITNKKAFLARPWRDYGCAAFIENKLDENILDEGFNKWNDTNRDKTARFYEYGNYNTDKRVTWINKFSKDESNDYLKNFLEYINYNKWV